MQQINDMGIVYDMLYSGGNIIDDESKSYRINDNLAKLYMCKTTHAYVISDQVYDIVLDSYKNINWDNPWNWTHHNEHRFNIDKWYTNNIQKRGNTYGIYPCLADQRSSFSDLLGRVSSFSMFERYNHIVETFKKNDKL